MSGDQSNPSSSSLTSSTTDTASSDSSSPPTAADLSRIAREDALIDRLMERKLQVLEAEYQATLNAELTVTFSTSPSSLTASSVAHAAGYINASDLPHHAGYSQHEEEFSEAWTQFRADCIEEEQRIAAIQSDDENESLTTPPTLPLHAPLTADKILTIKSVMSSVKLRPPPWAIGMSEEQWMSKILLRAGFTRKVTEVKEEKERGGGGVPMSEEEKRRRKEKKKLKKAKQAKSKQKKEEGQEESKQVDTSTDVDEAKQVEERKQEEEFEEFEPTFPSLPAVVEVTAEDESKTRQ